MIVDGIESPEDARNGEPEDEVDNQCCRNPENQEPEDGQAS